MYKIHTNTVTQYLYDTIANVQKKMYNSRNEEMYVVPKCRFDIFKKSFIPDDICKWNALPNDVHVIKSSTLDQFRRGISNVISKIAMLQCISILGKSMLNIIQTKLRHNCILKINLHCSKLH